MEGPQGDTVGGGSGTSTDSAKAHTSFNHATYVRNPPFLLFRRDLCFSVWRSWMPGRKSANPTVAMDFVASDQLSFNVRRNLPDC
ncbi:unnamed protein product [Calypogeia fissa]